VIDATAGRLVRLSGSVRAFPLDEMLPRAREAARSVGVTRVTDITRLDRLGIPVCVAIRPSAQAGNVCVSAGKGWSVDEARVGAMMEAVELAWAEPVRGAVPTVRVRVRDLLDGVTRRDAILDLAPRLGVVIDLEAPTLAVEARELRGDATALVPAELVFHPSPPFLGASYFGTGTNGLASGATVAEATLHALVELLERDAISFHNVRDASHPVSLDSLPAWFAPLERALDDAGARLFVRELPNAVGLPCFTAVVVDREHPQLSIRGDGLHLDRELALRRAIAEALQCRLTIIHGGRDDLDHFVLRFSASDARERDRQRDALLSLLEGGAPRRFDDIATTAIGDDLDATLASTIELLAAHGFDRVLRVVYTPVDHPVQVVRVIVPRLECCLPETRRVGRRLRPLIGKS
jgi:ribosomal protein S12 methylthiotransferase accessory factor